MVLQNNLVLFHHLWRKLLQELLVQLFAREQTIHHCEYLCNLRVGIFDDFLVCLHGRLLLSMLLLACTVFRFLLSLGSGTDTSRRGLFQASIDCSFVGYE